MGNEGAIIEVKYSKLTAFRPNESVGTLGALLHLDHSLFGAMKHIYHALLARRGAKRIDHCSGA